MILLGWLLALMGRVPRILERWKAPFLNGPGWFFGVQAPADFFETSGRALLSRYRLRLFLPWAVELPISAVLLATGHVGAILPLIAVITLLTRLNYYADRNAAEVQARRFEIAGTNQPAAAVALSLRPRTLGAYTNLWIEVPIVILLGASVAWLAYRYAESGDWQLLRGPAGATVFVIYFQIGLLLMKRGFVRARSAAPADNAETYLVWRESLRRLSTTICDYLRLLVAFFPLVVDLESATRHWQGSVAQTVTLVFVLVFSTVAAWYEWRKRQQHLETARAAKPRGFLVLPDTPDAARFVCFRPSLPILLLKGKNGYALNLASAPAKVAGLYLAGYALLMVGLTR